MYNRQIAPMMSGPMLQGLMQQRPQMTGVPQQLMPPPGQGAQDGQSPMGIPPGLLDLLLRQGLLQGGGGMQPGGLLSNFSSDPWKNVGSAFKLANIV